MTADLSEARGDDLGPCDVCGEDIVKIGWMVAVDMWDGEPLIQIGCSHPCRVELHKRVNPEAQAELSRRVQERLERIKERHYG